MGELQHCTERGGAMQRRHLLSEESGGEGKETKRGEEKENVREEKDKENIKRKRERKRERRRNTSRTED